MTAKQTEHFLSLLDWDGERLSRVIELAVRLKRLHTAGRNPKPFRDATIALLFEKPSLRTRVSFELAFTQLGGRSLYLSPQEVGLGKREAISDVARVLAGYVEVVAARTFSHATLQELARWSSIPVINALSDYAHPCQLLADLLTIREHRGGLDGLKVAWVGDGNNVANSWINAARRLGFELRLACPEGYDPDKATFDAGRGELGERLTLLRDPVAAVSGADVVYTDTWVSMGQEEERARRLADFAGWRVDEQLLSNAPSAIVLHCLPAHRGEEISDAAMDGPRSLVFPQAHNRLHAQKALLLSLMGVEGGVP